MDLLEVEIDQNRVIAFDGRVLEVFGGSVRRFHIELLAVNVSSPDKNGVRQVMLQQPGTETGVPLDEAAFEKFQPVPDALQGAGVRVTT